VPYAIAIAIAEIVIKFLTSSFSLFFPLSLHQKKKKKPKGKKSRIQELLQLGSRPDPCASNKVGAHLSSASLLQQIAKGGWWIDGGGCKSIRYIE
jgi:hypothetical protein